MIKLIATDIDGTLVKDGSSSLPEELSRTIESVIDRGIIFAACTGRSMISARRLFGPLQERIHFIACNGTQIGQGGKLLFSEDVDRALLNKMAKDIRRYPFAVPFFTGDNVMYADTDDDKLLEWMESGYQEDITRVADITAMPGKFVKLSVFDKNRNSGESFRDFCEKWKGQVSMATAGKMWLDIYKAGVNKGTALRKLQASLGITPEETMAFGDQQNDIEMLKAASYSYAVENALPEVKKKARYVAGGWETGGVRKVMEELLRSQR